MKKNIVILLILFLSNILIAQKMNFGNFPSEKNNDKPILTSTLLNSLDWNKIKDFSDKNEGHFARESVRYSDDLLKTYSYVQVRYVANFKIVSFKGKVLEYYSQISNSPKQTEHSYFDKNIWLQYVHTLLPNLDDSLKLTSIESKDILKGYYSLIGADSRDEYGWICEYSTVPKFTERRRGVIELLNGNRSANLIYFHSIAQ